MSMQEIIDELKKMKETIEQSNKENDPTVLKAKDKIYETIKQVLAAIEDTPTESNEVGETEGGSTRRRKTKRGSTRKGGRHTRSHKK